MRFPGQNGIIEAVCRRLTPCPAPGQVDAVQDAGPEGFTEEEAELPQDKEDVAERSPGKRKTSVFIDAEAMKEKVRANLANHKRDTCYHLKDTGIAAFIAKHVIFERTMLAIIALNAIWIAVDTDYNDAEVLIVAHPVFQVAENLFCAAFSFEWIVRFTSFQKKKYALKDAWFVFDTIMVFMMVLETWVMTLYLLVSSSSGGGSSLGNSSVLKIARLMRLSRMARMARLLRAMPELMIMVKGMITAVRSVAITLTLLILIMYAFGIAFCQMTKGTEVGRRHFLSVLDSMYSLGIYGTLCDNIKYLTDELGKESAVFSGLFFLYVLLTAFTVMNMLIGVLCEVVSAVASTEREEILVTYVKSKVLKVVEEIDEDGDRHITKAEMVGILENASACRALKEVGVDVMSLVDNADAIFVDVKGRELEQLSFADFMHVVLSLRGTNNATVKDIVELRKSLRVMNEEIVSKFQPMMRQIQRLVQEVKLPRDRPSLHHSSTNVSSVPTAPRRAGVLSLPPELHDAPPAAERLELEGSWCPFGEAKAPEVPESILTKMPGPNQPHRRSPQQRGGNSGKPTHALCPTGPSPPATPPPSLLVPVQDGGYWSELPEAVPEEPVEIPDRLPPDLTASSRLLSGQQRPPPPPLEEPIWQEPTWHEMPPLATCPTPAALGLPLAPCRSPELPSLMVPEVPERRQVFDAASPCKCKADAPALQPGIHLLCKGSAEPGCEDTSTATCTPGSAEDGRCGQLGSRLPSLASEAGGWCPVGAVELRGHMAELAKSLTAGLCQVKRLEERLRQPVRMSPQSTNGPLTLPPVPAIGMMAPSVELE